MTKRGLMQILLAALLLVAQHGALSHQLRHLHDRLPAQTQQQNDKQKPHASLCDFHVSLAQVLGGVNCAARPPALASNTVEHHGNHFPRAFPADLVVAASRGPPVTL